MKGNEGHSTMARSGGILAAVACVFAAAAFLSYDATAQNCNSYTDGCSWGGAPVPCSNTEYCYVAPDTWNLTCTNGAQITHYQNFMPPSSWANCTQMNSSSPQRCKDTLQPCGTTDYYSGPCNPGSYCNISGNKGSVRWCKGPDSPKC